MQKRLLQLHYEESKVWFSYSRNRYHVENFLQLYLIYLQLKICNFSFIKDNFGSQSLGFCICLTNENKQQFSYTVILIKTNN